MLRARSDRRLADARVSSMAYALHRSLIVVVNNLHPNVRASLESQADKLAAIQARFDDLLRETPAASRKALRAVRESFLEFAGAVAHFEFIQNDRSADEGTRNDYYRQGVLCLLAATTAVTGAIDADLLRADLVAAVGAEMAASIEAGRTVKLK